MSGPNRISHGEHGDQNCGDGVAVRQLLGHAEQGYRRRGLNQHQAVKDQIPEAQNLLSRTGEPC